MRRRRILLAVTAAIMLATNVDLAIGTDGAPRGRDPKFRQATQLLDAWIESVIDFERLPGLSIAVVHDQEIVYARGFGFRNVDKRLEAAPGSVYGICSMSKMFTAVAVMQLRDAGRLDLDDPVSTHLPWFAPEGETAAEPITLRDLLRHSSGLPCEVDHEVWESERQLYPSREELVARAQDLKLIYPANSRFNYSNLGYSLLGEIIATVSGLDYEEYVRRNILDPLEMDDTVLFPPDQPTCDRLATGYAHLPRRPGPRAALTGREPGAFAPAGGYYSSVLDMAKFAMWQFRVRADEDERILGRTTLEEMQSPQWPSPKWGLGFTYYWIGDLDLYGHQGGCADAGFKSQFILCPEEETAVVVLINASDGPHFSLAFSTYEIMSTALKAFGEEIGGREDQSRFAGYYTSDRSWSDAEVVPWDGDLAVLWVPTHNPASALVKLRHVEGGTYRQVEEDGGLGKHYVFEADAAGSVRLRFNNNILRKVVRRDSGSRSDSKR
jgi:CubicO group peptidase (beta-lactamase class C family)